MHQQLALAELLEGAYWVEVYDHGTIKDGTRFLVVDEPHDGWLLGWRDGAEPRHRGTLIPRGKARRVENDD